MNVNFDGGPLDVVRVENSFIAADGVGEKTERSLWQEGVTHWEDVVDCSILGTRTHECVCEFVEEAKLELDAGNARFFADRFPSRSRWRLYENFAEGACFFDIETTGLDASRHVVTTVSFSRGDETTTLVRGDDLTREALERELSAADLLVSFNGARFDVPFIEQEFGLSVETPHLDLMYPCRRLDLTGGLKRIERDVGIERELPDVDGLEAVRLWHRYEGGDDAALDRLVRYNREDVRTLRPLAETVVERLDRDVFEPYRR